MTTKERLIRLQEYRKLAESIPRENWYSGGALRDPNNPDCMCWLAHLGAEKDQYDDYTYTDQMHDFFQVMELIPEDMSKSDVRNGAEWGDVLSTVYSVNDRNDTPKQDIINWITETIHEL